MVNTQMDYMDQNSLAELIATLTSLSAIPHIGDSVASSALSHTAVV